LELLAFIPPADPQKRLWGKMKPTILSKFFSWKEALWLPSWKIEHTPSLDEVDNILLLASKLDKVRELLGRPMRVHVWIRPTSVNCPGSNYHGENYNLFIGSKAKRSAHIVGKAVDFSCKDISCDEIRNLLIPHLDEWNLRMEDLPGSNWVHLDCAEVAPGGKRFFKP
jgi:hypothetical protein